MAASTPKKVKEIWKNICDVDPQTLFPLELGHQLRDKLATLNDQNWQLKQHINFQNKEISELKQYKTNYTESKDNSHPATAAKLVETTRRNREMTAKLESMKSKMQKLIEENNKLQEQIPFYPLNEIVEATDLTNGSSNQKTDDEILSTASEMHSLNSKMMHYRRQCQQLRMELGIAQRALAQEVGDGVTPHNILSSVNSGWRGRQQQIITLNQKVIDLQAKLQNNKPINSHHLVGHCGDCDAVTISETVCEPVYHKNTSVLSLQKNIAGIQQQEKKKHESLEKVTQELKLAKAELNSTQLDLKASKARSQTLETQIKTYRLHLEETKIKLDQKQSELDVNMNDLISLKQEYTTVRDRERNLRESTSIEIKDNQQALSRERAVIVRLQNVVAEKQGLIEKLETEIYRLQSNLDSCCRPSLGIRDSEGRIANMQEMLDNTTEVLSELEKERKILMSIKAKAIQQVEEERQHHAKTECHLAKSFVVVKNADTCIENCLEKAHITDKTVLKDVEFLKSLMRELKTGRLFSLESVQTDDVQKLKTQLNLLTKENTILQTHLKKSSEERRSDLDQFTILSDKMRSEFYNVLEKAVNSFQK